MNDDTRRHIIGTIDQWMKDIQDKYAQALRDLAVNEQECEALRMENERLRKIPIVSPPQV